MINKNSITKIVDEYFQDTDKFLIDVKITPQNKIIVIIDGDEGVLINEIAQLSRHIETFLDRDTEDFELEVTSAGIGKPLVVFRQYIKNIGRDIVIKTADNKKINGKLINAEDEGIEIELSKNNNKTNKQQNDNSEIKNSFIKFDQIKEAKIRPKF